MGSAWKDINLFMENISQAAVQVIKSSYQALTYGANLITKTHSERSHRLALFSVHCRTVEFVQVMGSVYQPALLRFAVYSEVDGGF